MVYFADSISKWDVGCVFLNFLSRSSCGYKKQGGDHPSIYVWNRITSYLRRHWGHGKECVKINWQIKCPFLTWKLQECLNIGCSIQNNVDQWKYFHLLVSNSWLREADWFPAAPWGCPCPCWEEGCRRACREQAICPKALSIVLSFFSWRELCRCVWTPAITAPLSNPSHEHKTRLKALSETEGRCVVGT